MKIELDSSWKPILSSLYQEPFLTLKNEILPNISYYPTEDKIFNVFQMPLKDIKVVILDLEPKFNTSTGYAFATTMDYGYTSSLRNIREELNFEFILSLNDDLATPNWRTLEHWREQGIFLLNLSLTADLDKTGEHLKYWQPFIERVIQYISSSNQNIIWLLWGGRAQSFTNCIYEPFIVKGYDDKTISSIPSDRHNYILKAPHPISYSCDKGNFNFIGCNHFRLTNGILKVNKKTQIQW